MLRRALAFLALFLGSLGLLLWLDPQTGGLKLGGSRAKVVDATGSERGSAMLKGRGEYTHFKGNRRQYELRFEDSEGPSEKVALKDLAIRLFDETDDRLVAEVQSARGFTRLLQGADALEANLDSEIRFEDVAVTLVSGSRLVPLTLTTEWLQGDLEAGKFETEARATVTGSGIEGEGTGLSMDQSEGRLRFDKDARASITVGTSSPGTIASGGPLVIRRGRDDSLWVVADRQAFLSIEGTDTMQMQARTIEAVGRLLRDEATGEEAVRFDSLDARGEVELRVRGNVLTGQRAEFELDPAGNLLSVRLSGAPSGTLVVEGGELGPGQSETLRIWGDGPLVVGQVGGLAFQMGGPAQLEWRDAELWAAGGISSRSDGEGGSANIRAWTDVELVRGPWKLSAPELSGEASGRRLDVTTQGSSRLEGTTTQNEQLLLLAQSGFQFNLEDEAWEVTRAERVNLLWDDGTPLTASADRLLEFRPDGPQFVAEGSVEVLSDEQFLRGERLTVRGETFLDLEGSVDEGGFLQRVQFDLPEGNVRALRVTRDGDLLTAAGGVLADLALEGLRLDVKGDSLEVRGPLDSPTAGVGRPVEVLAEGNVSADLAPVAAADDGRAYSLTSSWLRVRREPLPGEGEALTRIWARGTVRSRITEFDGDYRVRADSLDADLYDPYQALDDANDEVLAQLFRGSLVAEGEVLVEKLDGNVFTGFGQRFTLDDQGRGVLEAEPGGATRSKGQLLTGESFEMTAGRLQFDSTRFSALDPRILILGQKGGAADASSMALAELVASAQRMEATPRRLEFEGDTQLSARTLDGQRWFLAARTARFDRRPGADRDAGFTSLDELVAEDEVLVRFPEGEEANGDRLVADPLTQKVRLTGRCRMNTDQLFMVYEWIEYDAVTGAVQPGPGFVAGRRRDFRPPPNAEDFEESEEDGEAADGGAEGSSSGAGGANGDPRDGDSDAGEDRRP